MADRLKAETLADIIRAHKAARMTDNRAKLASLQQRLPADTRVQADTGRSFMNWLKGWGKKQ